MKKYIGLFILPLLIFIYLLHWSSNLPIEYDLLINKVNSPFSIQLFYSDLPMQTLKGFQVTSNEIRRSNNQLIAYTEGFTTTKNLSEPLKAINRFRQKQGLSSLPHIYQFYEDKYYYILASVGDLGNLYFYNKTSREVHIPNFDPSQSLGPMYTSHIRLVDDNYMILGGAVNSSNTYLYTVDLKNLALKDSYKLIGPSHAIASHHYTLDPLGQAIFISDYALQVFRTSSETPILLHLDFQADYILSNDHYSIALSIDNEQMHYALITTSLEIFSTGSLPLPNTHIEVIKGVLQDNYLYTISFDPTHKRYSNYLTIYDLTLNKMVYCLALQPYNDLALLDFELMIP